MPATIIQKETLAKAVTPQMIRTTSNMSEVESKPSGKTISKGWTECPNILILPSINFEPNDRRSA
jgi:hypothetical protein